MEEISSTLVEGYKIASGQAENSPYGEGSIELQLPFFRARGLDLSSFFPATLNLDIAPIKFELLSPDYVFKQIAWYPDVIENFAFIKCEIQANDRWYSGYIYRPDPATKPAHFHENSLLEVVAPFIEGLKIGQAIIIRLEKRKLAFYG